MNHIFKTSLNKTAILIMSILLIVMTLSCVVCSYTACDDVYADQIVGTDFVQFNLPVVMPMSYFTSLNVSYISQETRALFLSASEVTFYLKFNENKFNFNSGNVYSFGSTTPMVFNGTNLTVNYSYDINRVNNGYSVDFYYTSNNYIKTTNNYYSRIFVSGQEAFTNNAKFQKLVIQPCYNVFNDAALYGVAYQYYDTNNKILQIILPLSFAYSGSTSVYNNIMSIINNGSWNSFSPITYYLNESFTDNTYYQNGFNDGQTALMNEYSVGGAGYESIYNDAYNRGLESGKSIGYNVGYNQGVNNANQYTFSALISAVFDVPVQTIIGLLDWDILGVNLKTLLLSLFSVAVVIFIVKIALGRS